MPEAEGVSPLELNTVNNPGSQLIAIEDGALGRVECNEVLGGVIDSYLYVSFIITGKPSNAEVIGPYVFAPDADYTYNLTETDHTPMGAKSLVAFTSAKTFTLKKNGSTTVGTIDFASSGTVGTVDVPSGPYSFTSGDYLTLVAPASQDATGEGIGFTIRFRRAVA